MERGLEELDEVETLVDGEVRVEEPVEVERLVDEEVLMEKLVEVKRLVNGEVRLEELDVEDVILEELVEDVLARTDAARAVTVKMEGKNMMRNARW